VRVLINILDPPHTVGAKISGAISRMEISLLGKGTALASIRLTGCLIGILLWRPRESCSMVKPNRQTRLM
jgi:hypothetical protein